MRFSRVLNVSRLNCKVHIIVYNETKHENCVWNLKNLSLVSPSFHSLKVLPLDGLSKFLNAVLLIIFQGAQGQIHSYLIHKWNISSGVGLNFTSRSLIKTFSSYRQTQYKFEQFIGRRLAQGHRVHRVATAAFWRTFSHEGKISPGWWGWVVHAHPFLLHLQSPVKLQCTHQLSGQTHWPCFISRKICTLCTRQLHSKLWKRAQLIHISYQDASDVLQKY